MGLRAFTNAIFSVYRGESILQPLFCRNRACGLDYDGEVAEAGDDAVSGEEVAAMDGFAGGVLADDGPTLRDDARCDVAVVGGVDGVEGMCDNGDGGDVALQGGAVCGDVDAVSEAADDDHALDGLGETLNDAACGFGAVLRGMASAYNGHHVRAVERA